MKNKEHVDMVSFNKEDITPIIFKLGCKVENDIIKDIKTGVPEKCPACEKKITTENLGAIKAGSRLLFCDNTACIIKYLSEKELF